MVVYQIEKKEPKVWKHPEYQKLYNEATLQFQARQSESDYRNSGKGLALQTALNIPGTTYRGAKAVANTLGQGVTRAGISGYEAIGDLGTGVQSIESYGDAAQANGGTFKERAAAGKKAYDDRMDKLKSYDDRKYYNTPFGELGSVQKEMQYRAPRVIEGEDKLYTALDPMVDTILGVSDVTLVASAPKLIEKFGAKAAKKFGKQSAKEVGKEIEEASEKYLKGELKDEDYYKYVKNQEITNYMKQNKNMSKDEVKDVLLKDRMTDTIETKLETPLPQKEKTFVSNTIEDSIKKNGYDETIKNADKIQEGVVKQLDDVTTQSRMTREALQEGLDSGDEVVQQKAIASYKIAQEDLSKAQKAIEGKTSPKKVNRLQRKIDKIKTDISKQEGELITKQTKKLNEDIVKLENEKQAIIDGATTKKAKRSIKRKVNKIDKEIAKTNKKIANVGDDVRELLNKKQVKEIKAVEKTAKETQLARGVKQNKKIKSAQQETKAKSTRNAKPQKGIKKTIRKNTGQTDTSKVVKTTEKKALNNKLKATQRDLKAGKKLGKAEQSQLYKDLSAYAKASGLPMDDIGKVMTQKRVSNIKTSDQLENIKKAIDTKVGINEGKVLEQQAQDTANNEIKQITKDLKKSLNRSTTAQGKKVSYNKGGTTDKVLKGLESAANKAKNPADKAKATAAYKAAAETVIEAADKTAEIGVKYHKFVNKLGKTKESEKIVKAIFDRLGIPRQSNALSAFLYNNGDFTKELKKLDKISEQWKQGDKLMDYKKAFAFNQIGFKDADLLPTRVTFADSSLESLKNSHILESAINMFSNSGSVKNKYGVVGDMIQKAQEFEALKDGNNVVTAFRLKDLEKTFKKAIPKNQRKESMNVIQGIIEGKGVSGNEVEESIAKEMKQILEDSAKYLEKSDPKFKRVNGYFPRNDNALANEEKLKKLVNEFGLEEGTAKFIESTEGMNSTGTIGTMYNNMRSDTAGFLKHRKNGKDVLADNIFESMGKYQRAFEELRFIRESDPYVAGIQAIGEEIGTNNAALRKLGENMEVLLKKGWDRNKILDNATAAMYVGKLGLSLPSATANLIGGMTIDMVENGGIAALKGTGRFAKNPVGLYKELAKNGLLSNDIVEYGSKGITNKLGKGVSRAAMAPQKGAENIIRPKQILGLMTKEETAAANAGKLNMSPARRVEILDNISKTQGHFSALHTAPIFKTSYGKVALPFTRWMFNSGTVAWTAAKDLGRGMKTMDGKLISKSLMKGARAYALYWGGSKLYDYGTKDFSDNSFSAKMVKKAGQSMMDSTRGILLAPTAMLEAPLAEDAAKVKNSIAIAMADMGLVDYPYNYEELKRGRDIYFFGTTGEKMWGNFFDLEDESVLSMYKKYIKLSPSEKIQYERELKDKESITGRDVSSTFTRYKRYSKYNITEEEFSLGMIKSKKNKKRRVEKYLKTFPASERKANLNRLLNAKIVTRKDLE